MVSQSMVALVRCGDYELATVEQALRRSLDLLGGIGQFVKPNQRVLLKPNLLRAMAPEKVATTHPAVVAMMAKLVIEAGAHPFVLDSPGGPFTPALLKMVYRKSGMLLVEEYGAELNYDTESTQVAFSEGFMLHRLDLVRRLMDADVVINLPKLKTHNLTGLTMAVKNLFGLVPGILKISYHAKLQDRQIFCAGLLDIFTYVKPALNILDAVVAMEGNGPSGGQPCQVGALVASPEALSLDIVGASLVGYDPLQVLTTLVAADRGLTSGKLDDITVVGDTLDALRVPSFRKGVVAPIDPGLLPKQLLDAIDGEGKPRANGVFHALTQGWWVKQMIITPRAGADCTGCGYCAKHCPVGAIQMLNGKARMNSITCIRCYCCHELCPQLAVELKRPWLGRIFIGD